jgi:hypothetical protein
MVTQSMAQTRSRPLEITPLASPLAPLNTPLTDVSAVAKVEYPHSAEPVPTLTGEAIQLILANPTRVREIAILSELLQPPLAMRRRRRL